jgi:YesN/AraC family two-component response regulator
MTGILIVDDERLVRQMIRAILTPLQIPIYEAEDGQKAEVLVLEHCPDVVIMDIVMPEREGIETIIALRRRWPALKILAISGDGLRGHVEFLAMAMKLGADATLAKPFDRAQLLSAMAPLLSTASSDRAVSEAS